MKNIYIVLIFFFSSIILYGQNVPLNHYFNNYFAKNLHSINSNHHTSIKPYNTKDIQPVIDSAFQSIMNPKEGFIARKLFTENLIDIRSDEYRLIVNPLFNINLGKGSQRDDLLYTNTRGVQFQGRIGKEFTFYTDFYENQARFPTYVDEYITANNVVPGEGIPKVFKENGGRDWAFVTGIINYRPSKFFDFQFGQGKNFIGDGYRSLLLSDNTFTYPFLKITTSVWKLKYVNIFTQMSDIRARAVSGTHVRKYVTSHYLSVNLGKRLNVGIFESVIYHDSTGTRGYDVNYLNPIIFYRPIEFAVGSSAGNVLLGMNIKFKISDKGHLYGQAMIDEFRIDDVRAANGWWANKFAFQLGVKSFDFLTPGLTVQTEVNWVRPYTYTHTNPFQNYAHYNQPLAHPLGANFIENITLITYQKDRFFGEFEFMYASQGRDTLGSNWGTDVYLPNNTFELEYGNEIGQGVNTKILYAGLKVGYLFNPKTNLRFELGYTYRSFKPETSEGGLIENTTNYFYAGISTSLTNRYHDF